MKIKYTKWTFWITVISLFLGAVVLYYTIPKTNLTIFFDTSKNNNFFVVTNVGNKPATDVKISYALNCQETYYNLSYIYTDVPILTESNGENPNYKHFFDNRTSDILDFYFKNKDLCDKNKFKERIIYVPYSGRVETDCKSKNCDHQLLLEATHRPNLSRINVSRLICEPCTLTINTESKEDNAKFEFSFLNPIVFSHTLACVSSRYNSDCAIEMEIVGPSSLRFRSDADFYQPYSYEEYGIYLKYNSWREPEKIKEENKIVI